jgi:hypothetical protein
VLWSFKPGTRSFAELTPKFQNSASPSGSSRHLPLLTMKNEFI